MALPQNMRPFTYIALIIAFAALVKACSPNPHGGKVRELDSLYTLLEQAEKNLMAHSPQKTEILREEVYFISELAAPFLEGSESDSIFYAYEALKLPLNQYLSNYHSVEKELKIAKAQVKNLGNDLKKGFLTEHTQEYFEHEKKLAQQAIAASQNIAMDIENVLFNFNKLQPAVLNLIEENSRK